MPNESALLLNRAIAEERAGKWAAAVQTCELLFRSGVANADIVSLIEAVNRLGDLHRQTGNTELAEEYLELAFDLAQLHDHKDRAAAALNILAAVKQSRGDMGAAESTYLLAHTMALEAGDARLLGNVEQNLGTLANIRGDHTVALQRYLAGLTYLQDAGYLRGCASVYNNLGMLHIDLGKLDDAEEYFGRALEISLELNDVVTSEIVHLNRTEMFLARGDPDRARTTCDEAFEIASRLNDNAGRAEAMKYYGIIYRETGKLHLAETHLLQALQFASQQDPLLEAETQREMALVLRAQDRNREALTSLNRAHALFSQIRAKHDQADVNERIGKLEGDFLSLVRSWGESIEAKDRYTGGHCQRVADYACRIAEEAGIAEHDIIWFRMGAFLHDVGKMEVPAEILNKPGRLTDEERLIMERHTVIGDEMLAPVEFPWDIRPIVRSHHERWDGTGYPDRLVGEAIPFTARILRIADIFDALTTARSYRKPLSPEQAYAIMEDDYGSFDPDLFEIFRRLYPELADRARQAHSDADEEPVGTAPGEVVA
jgi:putative nucleotidyltransferase with HDIG domain